MVHGLMAAAGTGSFSLCCKQTEFASTILDGEIVALDDEGIPRFQLLQRSLTYRLGNLHRLLNATIER